jgi:hypothetical protein
VTLVGLEGVPVLAGDWVGCQVIQVLEKSVMATRGGLHERAMGRWWFWYGGLQTGVLDDLGGVGYGGRHIRSVKFVQLIRIHQSE